MAAPFHMCSKEYQELLAKDIELRIDNEKACFLMQEGSQQQHQHQHLMRDGKPDVLTQMTEKYRRMESLGLIRKNGSHIFQNKRQPPPPRLFFQD